MARTTNERLPLHEDHQFVFTILDDLGTSAVNIAGWTLSFVIKRERHDLDAAALVTKATGSGITISGTFDAVPATNTQVATVTVEDTDTAALDEGLYVYELKRTDATFATVLASGFMELVRGVHQ